MKTLKAELKDIWATSIRIRLFPLRCETIAEVIFATVIRTTVRNKKEREKEEKQQKKEINKWEEVSLEDNPPEDANEIYISETGRERLRGREWWERERIGLRKGKRGKSRDIAGKREKEGGLMWKLFTASKWSLPPMSSPLYSFISRGDVSLHPLAASLRSCWKVPHSRWVTPFGLWLVLTKN